MKEADVEEIQETFFNGDIEYVPGDVENYDTDDEEGEIIDDKITNTEEKDNEESIDINRYHHTRNTIPHYNTFMKRYVCEQKRDKYNFRDLAL